MTKVMNLLGMEMRILFNALLAECKLLHAQRPYMLTNYSQPMTSVHLEAQTM